jgi:hypothetical protein
MTDSRSIAQLVGPTLVVVTLSEALNLHIWSANIPAVTYLDGSLLFVAGLSIVRVHNLWRRGWPLLITLIAWGSICGGLFRMFAPEYQYGRNAAVEYATIAILFALGVFLTWRGFGRKRETIADRLQKLT